MTIQEMEIACKSNACEKFNVLLGGGNIRSKYEHVLKNYYPYRIVDQKSRSDRLFAIRNSVGSRGVTVKMSVVFATLSGWRYGYRSAGLTVPIPLLDS